MLNQGFVAVRDQETEHADFVCLKSMTDIFTSYLYLVYILNDELWMIDPDKAVRVHVLGQAYKCLTKIGEWWKDTGRNITSVEK